VQIIDSQVHCFDHPRPDMPWAVPGAALHKSDGDEMAAAMAAVGVAGAIMVSPFSVYHFDRRFALALGRTHPGPYGLVVPLDPDLPDLAETIGQWAAAPGAVGIRLMLPSPAETSEALASRLVQAAEAAGRRGLAVNLMCTGNLPLAAELARRCPDVQLVIDHLGLPTPFDAVPAAPFAALPQVLALARFPHVAIKVSGACALSHQPYPFADLWEPLARVFDAFGLDRCLWGTDWTRTLALVSYAEAVDCFRTHPRLSDSDRAMLMGGAVARIYRWRPAPA